VIIYKRFAPLGAAALALATVVYHSDVSATPLADDAERRMPKWPDVQRVSSVEQSTSSSVSHKLG
jgi:hypothetical protein